MSDDSTDEKCWGCEAIMPSFLECCPSCGWERPKPLSREARLRRMGVHSLPTSVKVLMLGTPLIVLVVAAISVAYSPQWASGRYDPDAVILSKPSEPIPPSGGFESRRAYRRRQELQSQWFAYNAQQERLEKKRTERERLRQAKLENSTTTK